MIKTIVRDTLFLQQVSKEASKEDLGIGHDLMDTLLANKEICVGLAANMIGYQKRVIVIQMGMIPLVMYNPVLLSKQDEYIAEEGCLSLIGTRKAKRYQTITVTFRDKEWKKQVLTLTDFTAQICQHELDHLEGILI